MFFELGQLVATRGVAEKMAEDVVFASVVRRSLVKHATGDWGNLCAEDSQSNDRALKAGEGRIFSAYKQEGLPKIWIITEADRSATTILFPNEY